MTVPEYATGPLVGDPSFQSHVIGSNARPPARVLHVHGGRHRYRAPRRVGVHRNCWPGGHCHGDHGGVTGLLVDGDPPQVTQRLDRLRLFQRRAAGTGGAITVDRRQRRYALYRRIGESRLACGSARTLSRDRT